MKNVVLIIILIGSCVQLNATNFTSTGNGNWNDPDTWGNGGWFGNGQCPAISDNVTINHVVTLTGNQSCYNVTVSEVYCSFWFGVCITYAYPELRLGTHTLTIAGSFTNNDIFTANTGKVIFTGTGTISGLASITFNDLTTNTSGTVTLGKNIAINNILTMTAGKINLATYTATLGVSAVSPGTLTYTAGWMYGGNLKRYFNLLSLLLGDAAGHFPIGSATDYRPFWVANTLGLLTGGTVTLSHTAIVNNQLVSFADATWGNTVRFLSKSYWSMTVDGILNLPSSLFSIRMQGTGLGPVNSVSDLNLCTSSGVIGLFSASGGTVSNPQVNRTGLSLGDLLIMGNNQERGATHNFYFGSKSSSSPLPINLLKFEVRLNSEQTVAIFWATASETNNDFFTIEKSSDAIKFEKLENIKGAGNSTSTLKYNTMDTNPLTGISYYRLKQTDFDGKCSYSAIVSINNVTKISSAIIIYPNPANNNDDIKINVPEDLYGKDIVINIYDGRGNKVYSNAISINASKKIITIASLPNLKKAVYFVHLNSNNVIWKQQLIVN